MANPFSKGWKYLMQSLDTAIEDNADPHVQIQQAAEAARKQHADITRSAAAIIGNRNQLEMKMSRLQEDANKLADNARNAIQQSDRATAAGNTAEAGKLNQTAELFASQLVTVEQELEQTKKMYAGAVEAAKQAEAQKQQADMRFQEQQQQIQQLKHQVDQAKMQEATAQSMQQMDGLQSLAADTSVPTLDAVREKIEGRYARALGAQELVEGSVRGRMDEITAAGNDLKAASRLEEIRAQMRGELASPSADASAAAVSGAAAATGSLEASSTESASATATPEAATSADMATSVPASSSATPAGDTFAPGTASAATPTPDSPAATATPATPAPGSTPDAAADIPHSDNPYLKGE